MRSRWNDLIATYRALVLSGAPIAEINAIRKHLSGVKGGRLARAAFSGAAGFAAGLRCSGRYARCAGVGADDAGLNQRGGLLSHRRETCLLAQLPIPTRELFERRALEETPKSDDQAFYRSRWWTVLSNQTAVEQASAAAERAGFVVYVDNSCDDWDYERAAEYLLKRLRELKKRNLHACADFRRGGDGEGYERRSRGTQISSLRWCAPRGLRERI